jgi:hypothetical protein
LPVLLLVEQVLRLVLALALRLRLPMGLRESLLGQELALPGPR